MGKMAGKMRFHSEYNAYSLTEVQSVIFCDKFARKHHRLVVKRILSRAKAKNGTETKNTSKWQIMLKRYSSVYTEGTDCKAYILTKKF